MIETIANITPNEYLEVYTETEEAFKGRLSEISWSETDQEVLQLFKQKLEDDMVLTSKKVDDILEGILSETGYGKGKVYRPVRLAVSSRKSGPHISDFLACFGKDKVWQRLIISLA